MTQDFSNDLGGSAPTKEPLHPAPVSLAEVSAEEPANSEGGATGPTEEAPRPAGEPPLPALHLIVASSIDRPAVASLEMGGVAERAWWRPT